MKGYIYTRKMQGIFDLSNVIACQFLLAVAVGSSYGLSVEKFESDGFRESNEASVVSLESSESLDHKTDNTGEFPSGSEEQSMANINDKRLDDMMDSVDMLKKDLAEAVSSLRVLRKMVIVNAGDIEKLEKQRIRKY